MKIRCVCGHLVVDQTDYLPYKADIIPDQDLFDLHDELDDLIRQAAAQADADREEQALRKLRMQMRRAFVQYTKLLYQCINCGRLHLDDGSGSLYVFAPENSRSQASLLRSVRGEQWKRPLRGLWDAQSGQGHILKFGGNVEEDFLQFDDWEELEAQYFETFNRLRRQGLLRNALLKMDGQVVHQWTPG